MEKDNHSLTVGKVEKHDKKFKFWVALSVLFLTAAIANSFFEIIPWALTYFLLISAISLLVLAFIYKTKVFAQKARKENESEVRSAISEARDFSRESFRLDSTDRKDLFEALKKEIESLESSESLPWTEYRVLHMYQLMTEFYTVEELRVKAQLLLEEIDENYVEDDAMRSWFANIQSEVREAGDRAVDQLDENKDGKSGEKSTDQTDRLRSLVKKLNEYVTDFDFNWAIGTATIKSLNIVVGITIPILLYMGLLPIFHLSGNGLLSIFDWGFLGMCGALTKVLLWFRKSKLVQVGERKGKEEMWRAGQGAFLGLIAGVVLYSMLMSGVLSGAPFPDPNCFTFKQVGFHACHAHAVFLGISAGFSFEWVFEHLNLKGN
ncbi:MAG: hypothetical protein IIB00_03390 [candidate division Zixibacteria bacterium]|nr:hypothetical protein [candidate division Zixibacteria bacterium]